jgi:hypothetical protein
MKITASIFILIAVLCFETAFAAPFVPTLLKFSAPRQVSYQFDGSELRIPVTVTGAPAEVIFSVYTHNCARLVNATRNGYLGWHYVDGIDTCIYISPPYRFQKGPNTVTWDGRYPGGRPVYRDACDYYLWGLDSDSPDVKATGFIHPRRFASAFVQTIHQDGKPLAYPVIFDGLASPSDISDSVRVVRSKWALGNDPKDPAFLETTAYPGRAEAPRLALSPREWGKFFTLSAEPGAATLRKREWVSNGDALLVTAWGNNGSISYPSWDHTHSPLYGLPFSGGPVSDGADRIYFPSLWPKDNAHAVPDMDAGIICVNIQDGAPVKKLALPWWSSPPDAVYCPDYMEYRNGMLFVSSPFSCLVQMIDPAAENEAGMVRWENGFGDGVWDKNLPSGSPQATWACFGRETPPYPENLTIDACGFGLFPATGFGAASFGGFAPDGTGMGYFPLPGLQEGAVFGLQVIDTGSAFDGILFSGIGTDGDSAGVWYRGCDSIKGIIAPFTDCFGPCLHISSPVDGDLMTPGIVRSVTWGSYEVDAIRIEFSPDGGRTWTTVVDSVSTQGEEYRWTVPNITSSECRLRIIDVGNPNVYYFMKGYFTITGVSAAGEEIIPSPFRITGFPNPFNSSVTLSFTLPEQGWTCLSMYDITGRKVRTLISGNFPAGARTTLWNGRDDSGYPVSSGVYLARLAQGKRNTIARMLLLK